MAKVIVMVRVEDPARWEVAFRSQSDLLRSQGIHKPVHYTVDDNRIVACFEPEDAARYVAELESPATAAAMEADGVDRGSVQVFLLDRTIDIHL